MSEWAVRPGETPVDPSFLIDKSIKTRAQLDKAEAVNILKAFEKYATAKLGGSRAFTYEWMLRVHRAMFCDVWTFAGNVRAREVNLGVAPHLIGQKLGQLAMDIAAWSPTDDLIIEHSARLHHRAVHIHPFENGNGRWARFLANLWLRRHRKGMIEWPEPSLAGGACALRDEYIAAIRQGDNHDLRPLMGLHKRYWKRS